MDAQSIIEKMNNCKWHGTGQCPNIGEMKMRMKPISQLGNGFSAQDIIKDAEFCRQCDKYQNK